MASQATAIHVVHEVFGSRAGSYRSNITSRINHSANARRGGIVSFCVYKWIGSKAISSAASPNSVLSLMSSENSICVNLARLGALSRDKFCIE